MINILGVLFLIHFLILFVRCTIPTLNVVKFDKNVIDQQRQDNVELCKMFNEESEKIGNHKTAAAIDRDNSFLYEAKQRIKRHIDAAYPASSRNIHKVPTINRPKRSADHRGNFPEDDGEFFNFYGRMRKDVHEEDHINRRKREAATTMKSRLNLEEQERIENLVDKLYDDDNGKRSRRIRYRKNYLQSTGPQGGRKKMFFFAPKLLTAEKKQPEEERGITGPDGPSIDWPKYWHHGVIPYFIDPKTYDAHLATKIVEAFDYFEKATCIRLQRLREKPTDENSMKKVEWIYITNESGIRQCVHSNEKKPNIGVQVMVLGYDCLSTGEVVHEVMHTLGFSHEHTRPDRDRYITVLWDNIKPGYKKYFEARKYDPLYTLPYDYASVMHYPARAFSRNGQLTILADGGLKIGQREGISEIDVEKVSMIFGHDCMLRNKNYLLTTCPSVIKNKETPPPKVSKDEIKSYFNDRLWPYGVVNFNYRDMMEFSADEKENIKAVMEHIQKETCIVFNENEKVEDDVYVYDVDDLNPPDKKIKMTNVANGDNAEPVDPAYAEFFDDIPSKNTLENDVAADAPKLQAGKPKVQGLLKKEQISDAAFKELQQKVHENIQNLRKNAAGSKQKKSAPVKSVTKGNSGASATVNTKNVTKKTGKAKNNIDAPNKTEKSSNGRIKRAVQQRKASRRHASTSMTLTRTSNPGCRCPSPGRSSGDVLTLELSADCFNSVNDLLHVFVHVLGLDHQHNMHDRDSYLHIVWANLTEELKEDMSKKLPPAASVGFPYDYQSVMHFPWLQIKNGVTNIMYPVWNDGWAMGHWQGLSSYDVQKLGVIYHEECQKRKNEEEA